MQNEMLMKVLDELDYAENRFPWWPTDPLHAMSILVEEVGETTKDLNELIYEPHKGIHPVKVEAMRNEAIQTAAMALRFLDNIDNYVYAESEKHIEDSE